MKDLIKSIAFLLCLQSFTLLNLHAVNFISPIDSPYFSLAEDMWLRMQDSDYNCNAIYVVWDSESVNPYRLDLSRKTDTTFVPLVTDTSFYVHPVHGRINSAFGPRGSRNHNGVDIGLNHGDSVLSAFSGIVRFAKFYRGYGNMIIITHLNGLETMYAHLSRMLVGVGDYVNEGDLIGRGGATGRASGNHLHFETRYMGVPFDPQLIINFDEGVLLTDTLEISKYTFRSFQRHIASNADAKYHVIKKGDTLYALSRRYGMPVNQICSLNGIKRDTVLRIGRTLRIQ